MTEKKKRGRKPKIKEKVDDHKIIENNIIHLKITKEECDNINNIKNYDNSEVYYELSNLKKEEDNSKYIIHKIKSYPYDNLISNNNSNNVHCYWCCHNFNSTVFTLPTRYINDTYYVYGTFCSPECACAYNFNDYKQQDKKWERYSLLNMLYRKLLNNNNLEIVSALPRDTLNIFGGKLNIEEFRKNNNNYKSHIELLQYPLVSHTCIQNEIELNYYLEMKDKKNFIPLDNNKIDDASNNLKIKRSKPLNKYKNTLESCMNLKYN